MSASRRTHCPYCSFQCGMKVGTGLALHGAVPSGEGVEIEGDDSFPVNRGQLCIKGFTAGALLRRPGRLLQPLRRDANDRLVPTTWELALDEIASRFAVLARHNGPEAVGVFGSGALTNEKAYQLGKFARVALRTPHVDYNGRFCMSSAAAAQTRAFGIDRGMPFPVEDVAHTRALVLWGSNAADTLPPFSQWLDQQRRAGGRLIVVDPRATPTARLADLHLAPVPGGDLALANGMLYVAIEEGLVDAAFVAARTRGFEEVRRAVLAYEPSRVERLTGVAERSMRQVVRLLAHAPSAMLLTGRGPEQQSKGVDTVLALINLMLALGKVGKPASGYGCLTGQGNGQGGREHGQKADQLPGYRSISSPSDRAAIARVWGVDPAALPDKGASAVEMISGIGTPGGLRGLLVMGSNLAVAMPDARAAIGRLAALETLVVCDSFANETTALAHFVLPVTQWTEEEGTMTNLEGRVLHRRPLHAPPAGVRGDLDVLCGLAARLGAAHHFTSSSARVVFDELRAATRGAVADYSGITYERLDAENGVHWPCPDEAHPGTPRLFAERFFHEDGRARFHAVEHRPAGEEPDAGYPIHFTTGRYKEHYNSGAQTRGVPSLMAARPEPRLELHPRLAARYGIHDGAPVLVESRRGAVRFRAAVTADIRDDSVFAPFHYGGAASANVLTNAALDPTSHMPEYKLCAVRIQAVLEPRATP